MVYNMRTNPTQTLITEIFVMGFIHNFFFFFLPPTSPSWGLRAEPVHFVWETIDSGHWRRDHHFCGHSTHNQWSLEAWVLWHY